MLCHFDTAIWNTVVCYEIVVLDLVQEVWNWARDVSLIFHTNMVANWGVKMVSVSSSLETVLSNTVHLTHLVQSCLEIGWLRGAEGVSLSLGLCSHGVLSYRRG